jgi:hypothetical protein
MRPSGCSTRDLGPAGHPQLVHVASGPRSSLFFRASRNLTGTSLVMSAGADQQRVEAYVKANLATWEAAAFDAKFNHRNNEGGRAEGHRGSARQLPRDEAVPDAPGGRSTA